MTFTSATPPGRNRVLPACRKYISRRSFPPTLRDSASPLRTPRQRGRAATENPRCPGSTPSPSSDVISTCSTAAPERLNLPQGRVIHGSSSPPPKVLLRKTNASGSALIGQRLLEAPRLAA